MMVFALIGFHRFVELDQLIHRVVEDCSLFEGILFIKHRLRYEEIFYNKCRRFGFEDFLVIRIL